MDVSREIEMGNERKKLSQSQCQVESGAAGKLPRGNGE